MNFERGLLRRMGLASTAVGAFLYAVLPMAEPAQAGDDNMFSSVTNFFQAPFGGGKPGADKSNDRVIDYRPRPALVVPPSYNLPHPQSSVTRSADWPKASDAAALREAKADSRRPAPLADQAASDVASGDAGQESRIIRSGAPAPQSNCTSVAGMQVCAPWGKISLPGFGKDEADSGDIRLNAHPKRKYLTDPPVDYMEAVDVPEKGHASAKGQDKAPASDLSITRAPPAVDKTPPGK